MGARVQWRDAQGLQGVVELSYGEIFIGRAMECAIRTDDPMVSRRHARITFQDGRHVIEDLGSANGIYVGDARTQVHALTNGDSIRCGSLWLTYQNDGVGMGAPGQGMMGAPGGGLGVGPQGTQMLVAPTGPPNLGGGSGPGGFGDGMAAPAAPPFGAAPMGAPSFGAGAGGPPPFGGPPPGGGGFGGPPPAFGGPPAGGFGGPPPPAFGGGMPAPIVPPGATSFGGSVSGGPPPPVGPPSAAPPAMGSTVDPRDEMLRMQRRIDQLTSELRILRGGGDGAMRMEELEEKVSRLERDNTALNEKCTQLERMAAQGGGGGSVSIGTAQLRLSRAEEVVNGLNDVLSELRINILAAEGEVEQWSSSLPRASYDLVRESLVGSRAHMETAKELMRMLRAEGR